LSCRCDGKEIGEANEVRSISHGGVSARVSKVSFKQKPERPFWFETRALAQ